MTKFETSKSTKQQKPKVETPNSQKLKPQKPKSTKPQKPKVETPKPQKPKDSKPQNPKPQNPKPQNPKPKDSKPKVQKPKDSKVETPKPDRLRLDDGKFKSKYKFDKIDSSKTFKFDLDSPDFDLDYARLRSAVYIYCKRNGCKLSCKKVVKGILVTRI